MCPAITVFWKGPLDAGYLRVTVSSDVLLHQFSRALVHACAHEDLFTHFVVQRQTIQLSEQPLVIHRRGVFHGTVGHGEFHLFILGRALLTAHIRRILSLTASPA